MSIVLKASFHSFIIYLSPLFEVTSLLTASIFSQTFFLNLGTPTLKENSQNQNRIKQFGKSSGKNINDIEPFVCPVSHREAMLTE